MLEIRRKTICNVVYFKIGCAFNSFVVSELILESRRLQNGVLLVGFVALAVILLSSRVGTVVPLSPSVNIK
jgi:hypothetical protein